MKVLRNNGLVRVIAIWCCLSFVGCGSGNVEMREINPTQGVPQSDVTKVKELLKAAGITGEILQLEDMGGSWDAVVSTMKPAAQGKRASPSPPTSYSIDKATGKVTSAMSSEPVQ